MATRTWISTSSTDMNLATNYSGSGALLTTDDLVFDATSVVNAAATADLDVGSITITSGFTGTWSFFSRIITCNTGNFTDDGATGNHTYGTNLNLNATNAVFHVGGSSSINAAGCRLTYASGSGTLDDDKGISLALTIASGVTVTTTGSAGTSLYSLTTPLIIGDNATFTSNTLISIRNAADGQYVYTIGSGAVWDGTGDINMLPTNQDYIMTFPGLIRTGGNLTMGYGIYNITGDIDIGTKLYSSRQALNAAIATLTFNDVSVTCGEFRMGSQLAGATTTINCGASIFNVASFTAIYNTGTINYNFSSSQWTCAGAWTLGSAWTVDAGSSLLTLSGSAAQSITLAGKSLYDITINKTGANTVTFANNISCHTFTVHSSNTANMTYVGMTLTATGDVIMNGAGTLNLGNGLTLNGASSTLNIGSTVSTVTATSCIVTINTSLAGVINDNKATQFKQLVIGTGAIVENSGSNTSYYTTTDTPFTCGSGVSVSFTRDVSFRRQSSGDIWSIGAGATFAFTGLINIVAHANNLTIGIPAITATGTGGLNINSVQTNTTFNISGNIVIGGSFIAQSLVSAASAFNMNFNDYNITCGIFSVGARNALAVNTFNYGDGTFTVGAFNGSTYNTGTAYDNFATSQWICTGAWTFGSNHTIDPGASLVTLSDSAAQTITLASKSLYDLTINKTGANTVTFADNISCHTFTVHSSNTAPVTYITKTLTATGDVIMNGTGTLNLGNSITMTSNTGTLTTASTLGTVTASSCNLVMNGTTGMTINDVKSIACKSLTLGDGAIVSGNPISVASTTTPLILGVNAELTITKTFTLFINGSVDSHTFASGAQIKGTSLLRINPNTIGITVTVPALTCTGGFYFLYGSSSTINLTGPLTCGAHRCYSSVYNFIFNQNGQTITCGQYGVGVNGAGSATYNFDGILNCTSFVDDFNVGPSYINMGSGIFNCSGSWSFNNIHVVNPGTSKVTFINTASITLAGKSLFNIILRSGAAIVTLQDDLMCNLLTIATGTLNRNGKTVTAAEEYTSSFDCLSIGAI